MTEREHAAEPAREQDAADEQELRALLERAVPQLPAPAQRLERVRERLRRRRRRRTAAVTGGAVLALAAGPGGPAGGGWWPCRGWYGRRARTARRRPRWCGTPRRRRPPGRGPRHGARRRRPRPTAATGRPGWAGWRCACRRAGRPSPTLRPPASSPR